MLVCDHKSCWIFALLRGRIVAIGTRGTGHEYLFVGIFRCYHVWSLGLLRLTCTVWSHATSGILTPLIVLPVNIQSSSWNIIMILMLPRMITGAAPLRKRNCTAWSHATSLCKACFLRYQVALQLSAPCQCSACVSHLQQHAQCCLRLPRAQSDCPPCLPQKAPQCYACPSQTARVVLLVLGGLPGVTVHGSHGKWR